MIIRSLPAPWTPRVNLLKCRHLRILMCSGTILLMQSKSIIGLGSPPHLQALTRRIPITDQRIQTSIYNQAGHANLPALELIASSLTLTPAFNFYQFEGYFFAHGILQIYPSSSISWLSDSYYFLGQLGSTLPRNENNNKREPRFAAYHSVFSGVARHWRFTMHDLFVAFQPGLSLIRWYTGKQWGVNPSVALTIGYHLYFCQWFHFFVHFKGIVGENLFDAYWRFIELRLSAGLGIHLKIYRQDNPSQ